VEVTLLESIPDQANRKAAVAWWLKKVMTLVVASPRSVMIGPNHSLISGKTAG
jgi:hypothetical protein